MLSFLEYKQLQEMSFLSGKTHAPPMLTDKKQNKQYYDYFKLQESNNKLLYKLTDYASIYKNDKWIFCLDDKLEEVTYFLIVITEEDKNLGGKYVYQDIVWVQQNPKLEYLSKIPSKIFYEVLLPMFGIISNSRSESEASRDFWEGMINRAFVNHLNVYYYNSKELIRIVDKKSWEEFKKNHPTIWNALDFNDPQRMVISKKDLKEF